MPSASQVRKGDHVMAGFGLDGVDPVQIRLRDMRDLGGTLGADDRGRLRRDGAVFGHALGRRRLDIEPDPVAVFR